MMKFVTILLIVALATVSARRIADVSIPTFPNDWSGIETDELVQFQGDYVVQGNLYACPLSSNCQVETQYSTGMSYYDFTNNRTRSDNGNGQYIVTLYTLQITMLVQNGVCQSFCPLQGDTMDPSWLPSDATYTGPQTVNGKIYASWTYKDMLGSIVMDTNVLLVDNSTNPVTPFQQTETLTPFGDLVGQSESSWSNFKWGTPDASLFKVTGIDSCQQNSNCGNNQLQAHRRKFKQYNSWLHYRQTSDSLNEDF